MLGCIDPDEERVWISYNRIAFVVSLLVFGCFYEGDGRWLGRVRGNDWLTVVSDCFPADGC